jgi:hypothetical protein
LKDYYKILGIEPKATEQEIKKSFRQLALKFHPYKNQGDPRAAAKFLEIQEAYQVLIDARERAQYDQHRYSAHGYKHYHQPEVTPIWILHICKKLNKSLEAMDTHRMSHGALCEYIHMILCPEHLSILQLKKEAHVNEEIIHELLQALYWLEPAYQPNIIIKLQEVAATAPSRQAIEQHVEQSNKQQLMRSATPWTVIVTTLLLCLLMYFYGKIK